MRTFAQKQKQPQRQVSSSLALSLTATPRPHHRADPILHLQRTIGNQAVLRMLQTTIEDLEAGLTVTASPRFGHDFSRIPIHSHVPGAVQTTLAINKPGDEYEQEADQIEKAVVHMPDAQRKPGLTATNQTQTLGIQRLSPRFEEEIEEVDVHAKLTDNHSPQVIASFIQTRIDSLRGLGQELPASVKSYFESRFGHDFGTVRLHTDSRAAQLAQSLNARAFTVGRDVVFGTGQYAPQTLEGKRLIAHELAHVLQQSNGRSVIRRQISFETPAYTRENPIDRVLHGTPVGLTTPTFNGTQLPADPKSASTPQQAKQLFNQAGQIILNALTPKEQNYNQKTKECTFAEFEVKVSANVIIPTQPKGNKWTMSFPGPEIPNCKNEGNVPVVMSGRPDSDSVGKWIESNEQEHVDDLQTLYTKHVESTSNGF